MTEPEDQRLVSNLRAGRPEARALLVRGHYRTVYRFLVHLTRDVHEAEDLTQETFAAAWEKIAKFHGRATLATWLHRIAYTKFIDAQRARRRAAGLLERLTSPNVSSADPLAAVIAHDVAQRLYHALHELDAPDRTVLVLHYLQSLSNREVEKTRAIYVLMATKLELPLLQFEQEYDREVKKQAGNPVFMLLFPDISRVRWAQARADVRRALLSAALAVRLEGPEALKNYPDPVVGGPFEHVAFDGGFELRSKLKMSDKLPAKWQLDEEYNQPLVLTIGVRGK